MIVQFDFSIWERVEIIELARTGYITDMGWDGTVKHYRVRYFDNGNPQSICFYAYELRKIEENKPSY